MKMYKHYCEWNALQQVTDQHSPTGKKPQGGSRSITNTCQDAQTLFFFEKKMPCHTVSSVTRHSPSANEWSWVDPAL